MKEIPMNYDYHNSRNFDADTYDRLTQESAMPFVTSDPVDMNGDAMITHAQDAAFHATPLDACVEADGSVTTRAKAGPANMGGDFGVNGGTP